MKKNWTESIVTKVKRVKVTMKFNSSYDKWEAKKAFNVLGEISPLYQLRDDEGIRHDDGYYFNHLSYSTSQEWYEYATNNSLTLQEPYQHLTNEQLVKAIENICYDFKTRDFSVKAYETL